jgi:hypothetical protein
MTKPSYSLPHRRSIANARNLRPTAIAEMNTSLETCAMQPPCTVAAWFTLFSTIGLSSFFGMTGSKQPVRQTSPRLRSNPHPSRYDQ